MRAEDEKAKVFAEGVLRDALQGFIGTIADLEAVKHEVAKTLERLRCSGEPGIIDAFEADVDVIRDTVHVKFKQEGFLLAFRGPFYPWLEDGVVHVTGWFGDYQVRACDYVEVSSESGRAEGGITCLTCLILNIATDT